MKLPRIKNPFKRRRKYTIQAPRRYFPRSEFDQRMGRYECPEGVQIPPWSRVFNAADRTGCIPPVAMKLLMLKISPIPPGCLATYFARAEQSRDAALLIQMFGRCEVGQWLFLLWALIRTRPRRAIMRALALLLEVDSEHGGGQTGGKSAPAVGAGNFATTA